MFVNPMEDVVKKEDEEIINRRRRIRQQINQIEYKMRCCDAILANINNAINMAERAMQTLPSAKTSLNNSIQSTKMKDINSAEDDLMSDIGSVIGMLNADKRKVNIKKEELSAEKYRLNIIL